MKVLFFAPHSAIWLHAFPEALVAEALQQQGHEVVYMGCDGLLSRHCVSMSAYGVGHDAPPKVKERICRLCRGNKRLIRREFGLRGTDLSGSVTDEDMAFATRLVEPLRPETAPDLVVDGVDVGKIALYELLLHTKKTDLHFSPDEWRRYQSSLTNCLLVLSILRRTLSEVRPDRILVYNALYSVNHVVCNLAAINGIPQYYLHAGPNLSKRLKTLILARGHALNFFRHMKDTWAILKDRPASEIGLRAATNHFLEVATGKSVWAYSSAPTHGSDLRARFGVGPDMKVITATLSSQDEFLSAQLVGVMPSSARKLFATQVDWIKALVEYVRQRKDLLLILRVHPREFPNKREQTLSQHAGTLKELFASLPSNIRVNWPTDNLSLYDLANITDVFVNAWSTAGKEMAWLGLPVVLYSEELTDYPPDLNYVGTTEQGYFQQLELALSKGWDPERIRQTYRWCAIEYHHSFLEIAESYGRKDNQSFISKGVNKILRAIAPYQQQNRDCRKRARRLDSSEKIHRILENQLSSALDLTGSEQPLSSSEEMTILKQEVKRLLEALYGSSEVYPRNSLAKKLHDFCNNT